MRFVIALLLLCASLSPKLLFAEVEPAQQITTATRSSTLELLLDRAVSQHLIAGGVIVVGNHTGIVATASRGSLNGTTGSPQLNEHTLFDLASLTKVTATAPAVMKLLDEGRIALNDPLSRYFPEFAGREPITVLNLLTHTSGLDDVGVSSSDPMESTVRKAAAERGRPRPGTHFHYADINFILLGELVHRVSGETLDAFCQQEIFGPMGDQETMFLPPRELTGDIAPTSGYVGGVVQDNNARRLGGVAGHAGLFSSAYDLSRYARLMLGGGIVDDKRILSEQVVSQMTTPYSCSNGRVLRGLGWDISSPYSAPRGNYFSSASFGHTGYSGSSIWIDPQQDLFVILLTRRSNYENVHAFNQLRRDVSTIASADFRLPAGNQGDAPAVQVAQAQIPRVAQAQITQEVVLATSPTIEATIRTASYTPQQRVQHSQHARRHFASVKRLVAKACGPRHGVRFRGIARAEAKGHRPHKRRVAVRG